MLLCCNHPPLSTSVHCICMYLVLRMVLHMVVIQCLDSFPFQFCSQTNGHASCRWCCASCQLMSAGSQLCMHPVCHSDGLSVSTGCGTHSALPTRACTPIVLISSHSMKEALILLTNSDFVLHVSSELCFAHKHIHAVVTTVLSEPGSCTCCTFMDVCVKELYHLQHSCLVDPCSSFPSLSCPACCPPLACPMANLSLHRTHYVGSTRLTTC